jgi:integrase
MVLAPGGEESHAAYDPTARPAPYPPATLALQAGIHPKVVSERLGHATVSITLDTYSHAIPAMQEEVAALIAGLVFADVPAAS